MESHQYSTTHASLYMELNTSQLMKPKFHLKHIQYKWPLQEERRCFFGEYSVISEIQFGIKPPIPIAAIKRMTVNQTILGANPAAKVKYTK